jgi:hypothetical protein
VIGTKSNIESIFDIFNHSLGMNINNSIIKVKIEIVKLKELDKVKPEFK